MEKQAAYTRNEGKPISNCCASADFSKMKMATLATVRFQGRKCCWRKTSTCAKCGLVTIVTRLIVICSGRSWSAGSARTSVLSRMPLITRSKSIITRISKVITGIAWSSLFPTQSTISSLKASLAHSSQACRCFSPSYCYTSQQLTDLRVTPCSKFKIQMLIQ